MSLDGGSLLHARRCSSLVVHGSFLGATCGALLMGKTLGLLRSVHGACDSESAPSNAALDPCREGHRGREGAGDTREDGSCVTRPPPPGAALTQGGMSLDSGSLLRA